MRDVRIFTCRWVTSSHHHRIITAGRDGWRWTKAGNYLSTYESLSPWQQDVGGRLRKNVSGISLFQGGHMTCSTLGHCCWLTERQWGNRLDLHLVTGISERVIKLEGSSAAVRLFIYCPAVIHKEHIRNTQHTICWLGYDLECVTPLTPQIQMVNELIRMSHLLSIFSYV